MHKSTDRILTTHAGSMPRGEPLGQMLIDQEGGKPVENSALQSSIDLRVSHVLEKQAEAGIDIVNVGEQGRVGFQTYVTQRMSGFGGVSKRPYGKEFIEYPQFTKRMMERLGKISKVFDAPEAIADVKYRDTALIDAEIERLTRQSAAVKPRVTEFFMNAPSPGIVATTMLNAHYASHEAYLDAIAREIRTEYLAVTNAGFVLQIDAPDLAMERVLLFQDMSDMEYAKLVEQHVAALNKVLEGIPPDSVRLDVCWGNWEGPHIHDVAMEIHLAGALSGESGYAGTGIRQSAPSTRNDGVTRVQAARPADPDPRRDRSQEQLCRTSRSSCATHRGCGGRGGRPRARDRRRRLRLRHLRWLGMGHRGCDVGQTGDIARRGGHRVAPTMEQEGSLSRLVGRSL
jgi:methionine synthase II (cobalamin-independent)